MPRALDPAFTLGQIVDALGGELCGDRNAAVTGIASLRQAGPEHIAFLARPAEREAARQSRAGAFIVLPELVQYLPAQAVHIVDPDAYGYYARLSMLVSARLDPPLTAGLHPAAHVHPQARIGHSVRVDAGAVIEAGALIGEGAWIGPGCHVAARAVVGAGSRLHANVVLLEDCRLGERCLVHPGAVIGSDGFGFAARRDGSWQKIAQLGAVVIGDDVEIGANTCIDRGALDDTVIGDGVKLDNLVQIGHGARVGQHTAMAGKVAVAGSARIGSRVRVGGASGIAGHMDICDGAVFSPMSAVARPIDEPGFYTGLFPLMNNAQWERVSVSLAQLPNLRRRLIALEKSVASGPDMPDKPNSHKTNDSTGAPDAGR